MTVNAGVDNQTSVPDADSCTHSQLFRPMATQAAQVGPRNVSIALNLIKIVAQTLEWASGLQANEVVMASQHRP
jgi:hypothetical protein